MHELVSQHPLHYGNDNIWVYLEIQKERLLYVQLYISGKLMKFSWSIDKELTVNLYKDMGTYVHIHKLYTNIKTTNLLLLKRILAHECTEILTHTHTSIQFVFYAVPATKAISRPPAYRHVSKTTCQSTYPYPQYSNLYMYTDCKVQLTKHNKHYHKASFTKIIGNAS